MASTFKKLSPHFVAEVSPVDLRQVRDKETLEQIRAGMDEYAVLVFRDQRFSHEEQLDFAHHVLHSLEPSPLTPSHGEGSLEPTGRQFSSYMKMVEDIRMRGHRLCVAVMAAPLMVLNASVVSGQDYPTKPIRLGSSAAGSGTDFTARLVAQGIAGPLGQQVIVDNRSSPILSGEYVAKAPPDGYTLLVAGGATWIRPLFVKLPWDPIRDFTPITLIDRSPNVVAVHPSMPVKSIKELIALAKARPGELLYGSLLGGPDHLAAELLQSLAGIKITHVPYKSVAPALQALLGGEVQITFSGMAAVMPHVKSGRLRALAVTSAEPSALLPEMPTVAATVPGFSVVAVTGMWAPIKTPVAIINRLNQEIVRFLRTPEAKEKFLNAGIEPVGNSPEEFAALIKADMALMSKVIKDAGIKTEH